MKVEVIIRKGVNIIKLRGAKQIKYATTNNVLYYVTFVLKILAFTFEDAHELRVFN